MRFRPEQHLRRQSDIRAVRERGRRVECGAFTVWWKPRQAAAARTASPAEAAPERQGPRVCVIASSRAVGNAVRRNRAKRRLREVFRHQQNCVPATCDLLLIARAAAVSWPVTELGRRFSEMCAQIPGPAAEREPA